MNYFVLKKMALLSSKLKLRKVIQILARYKHSKDHWSVLKKKKTVGSKALEHFDDFYGSVYGEKWNNIRAALLEQNSKYMAIVNNFSDAEDTQSKLELLGAFSLKNLYNVQKENIQYFQANKEQSENVDNLVSKTHLSKLESIYPPDHSNLLEVLNSEEDTKPVTPDTKPEPIELQSIDADLNEIDIDTSRIVNPSVDVSSLYEHVPATKIKGANDWVLESDHYKFYTTADDFKIDVMKESILPFPEHLHMYAFESGNNTSFPSPETGSTGVLDYYLYDGASVLPVLALDLQLGDVVLDMCAAPGGKSLTILQTLMPTLLVANDVTRSRVMKINNVMEQYVSDICKTQIKLNVTEQDARAIDAKDVYNKILVDAPCIADRYVLHSEENNIFKPTRIKERLKIQEVQTEILANALKLVKVGGTVVYATCSLSPIQNDGVVKAALKNVCNETASILTVKDMSEALLPLRCMYKFDSINLKYGHIVVPTLQKNWGPVYFCKIVKVR